MKTYCSARALLVGRSLKPAAQPLIPNLNLAQFHDDKKKATRPTTTVIRCLVWCQVAHRHQPLRAGSLQPHQKAKKESQQKSL
jgi:hypothetical protein